MPGGHGPGSTDRSNTRSTPPARRPDDLTPVGRLVYGAGFLARLASRGFDAVLDRAADTYVRSERAFREGRDGVDEAEIVRDPRRPRPPR